MIIIRSLVLILGCVFFVKGNPNITNTTNTSVSGFNWSYFPTITVIISMLFSATIYFMKTLREKQKLDNEKAKENVVKSITSTTETLLNDDETANNSEIEMTEISNQIFPELASSKNKRLDQITWLGTFLSNKKSSQNTTLDQQFDLGVRYFNVQLHWYQEFNTGCYGTKITEYPSLDSRGNQGALYFFEKVLHWIENNPKAIITIFIENKFDIDEDVVGNAFMTELEDLLIKSNLLDKCYEFSDLGNGSIPTINEMVLSDKRLIILSDADYSVSKKKEWIIPHSEFFEYNKISQGDDSYRKPKTISLRCMNHKSEETNSEEDYVHINSLMMIQNHLKVFLKNTGKYPNYIIVNFAGKGDCRKAVENLNLERS